MTGVLTRIGAPVTLVGCLVTLVCATGCPWSPIGRSTDVLFSQGEEIGQSEGRTSTPRQPLPDSGAPNAESPSLPIADDDSRRLTDGNTKPISKMLEAADESDESAGIREKRYERILAADTWIRAADVWDRYSQNPVFRWRYPALEEMLVDPSQSAPILARFAAHEDPIVAANAAIGLTRQGDASATKELLDAIRNSQLDFPIRRAAVESLASLNEPSPLASLHELLDDYHTDNGQTPSFRSPGLHAELIRGLSWHVRPSGDPRFSDALASDDADVKIEALRAWIADLSSPLPETAVWLREDRDWRVRAAALTAMARRRDDKACDYLAAALGDPTLKVRAVAIAGLGELRSAQAARILEGLLEDPSARIRAEAVAALAAMESREVVLAAAGDESWQVRKAVARSLAKWSDRNSAAIAEKLLDDRSCGVQEETVAALSEWPLESSGPLLILAMASETYATRRSAAEQLESKWPPASEFVHDGPVEQREQVLRSLEDRLRLEIGSVDTEQWSAATLGPTDDETPEPSADHVSTVQGLLERLSDRSSPEPLRREAISQLRKMGPELVASLERLARNRKLRIPEDVYRDVLPDISADFMPLKGLASPDVLVRRRAAADLAQLAAERPLHWLSLDRLSSLSMTETDQLVLSGVLKAVADDRSETAARIAYTAISHTSPEVRRLACLHLAAHPHAAHVRFLTPALEDSSVVVVRAAVEALGLIKQPAAVEPLERLLVTANESLRVDVAIALARLNAPSGPLELERLSYSADESVRHRVAAAMGQIPHRDFIAHLIRMLDDRHTIRRAALDSLPQVVGHDAPKISGNPELSFEQRLQAWKEWGRRQSSSLAGRPEEPQTR